MNNNGLSEEEVKKYRNLYGTNEIVKTKSNSFLKLLLMSLGDPMIKILLIVLALKFVFLFAENDFIILFCILLLTLRQTKEFDHHKFLTLPCFLKLIK